MSETISHASAEPKFEEALGELERIVTAMEAGALPLEDMMKQFERGMKLAKFCSGKLGDTEKRIEILMKNANGELEWQAMAATDRE